MAASTTTASATTSGRRLRASECNLDDFVAVVSQQTDLADFPYAERVDQGVLIYDAASLRSATGKQAGVRERIGSTLERKGGEACCLSRAVASRYEPRCLSRDDAPEQGRLGLRECRAAWLLGLTVHEYRALES